MLGNAMAEDNDLGEVHTSYALVVAEKSGDESTVIVYQDAGPQVSVELQPSRIRVAARVGMSIAGEGEGEWYPFVEGDEVLVAIPDGDPRNGVVILARLTNARDTFPMRVAGQNARANKTGIRRQRAPFLWEIAEGWLLRQSASGAFISMEKAGRITIAGSTGAFLTVRDDFVGMQGADPELMIQVNDQKAKCRIQAKGSLIEVKQELVRVLAPQVAIMASGLPPVGHAVTTEAVVNIIVSFMTAWAAALTPIALPMNGSAIAATISPAALLVLMNAAMGLASVGTVAPYLGAIAGALSARTPDASGNFPGVGHPGVTF